MRHLEILSLGAIGIALVFLFGLFLSEIGFFWLMDLFVKYFSLFLLYIIICLLFGFIELIKLNFKEEK